MKDPENEAVDGLSFLLAATGFLGLVASVGYGLVLAVGWLHDVYGTAGALAATFFISLFLFVTGMALRVGYIKYVEEGQENGLRV